MAWVAPQIPKIPICLRWNPFKPTNLEPSLHSRNMAAITLCFSIIHLSSKWVSQCLLRTLYATHSLKRSVTRSLTPLLVRHHSWANRWSPRRQNQQTFSPMNSWCNLSSQVELIRTFSWMNNLQSISILRTHKFTSASETTRECCSSNQCMLEVASTLWGRRLESRPSRGTSGVRCQGKEEDRRGLKLASRTLRSIL